jgi:hypothetical protein
MHRRFFCGIAVCFSMVSRFLATGTDSCGRLHVGPKIIVSTIHDNDFAGLFAIGWELDCELLEIVGYTGLRNNKRDKCENSDV